MRRYPVYATVAGQRIETTVDSEDAKYYLEGYLQGHRDQPQLDRAIVRLEEVVGDNIPDRNLLRRITQEFSVDFATAFLADRLLRDQPSARLRVRYAAALDRIRGGQLPQLAPETATKWLFLVVPGWVYESRADSGADMSSHRKLLTDLGLENRLIPIAETGTIDANAEFVAAELEAASARGKRVIVISASTGGPSTAKALALLDPHVRQRLAAWVNVGGLLQGSGVADAATSLPWSIFSRAMTFFQGWDYASIKSMETEVSRVRFAKVRTLHELPCINYIGLPFSGDIDPKVKREFRRLSRDGPNDGLTLIVDALVPDAATIVALGVDHYHRDAESILRTTALMESVLEHLDDVSGTAGAIGRTLG